MLGVLACAGAAMLPTGAAVDHTPSASAAPANAATGPGNGFVVTPGDLVFILKNIKIAERHAAAFRGDPLAAPQPNPDPLDDPNYCQAQLGSAVDQVPDPLTSYGLRTTDGSCNNLVKNSAVLNGHDRFGASDQVFPRLTGALQQAEGVPAGFFGPGSPPIPTSYVRRTRPQLRLRLAAARDQQPDRRPDVDEPGGGRGGRFPVRTQGDPGADPCDPDPTREPPSVPATARRSTRRCSSRT